MNANHCKHANRGESWRIAGNHGESLRYPVEFHNISSETFLFTNHSESYQIIGNLEESS